MKEWMSKKCPQFERAKVLTELGSEGWELFSEIPIPAPQYANGCAAGPAKVDLLLYRVCVGGKKWQPSI